MLSKNLLFGYPWATKSPKMRKMGIPENTQKKRPQKDTTMCQNGPKMSQIGDQKQKKNKIFWHFFLDPKRDGPRTPKNTQK